MILISAIIPYLSHGTGLVCRPLGTRQRYFSHLGPQLQREFGAASVRETVPVCEQILGWKRIKKVFAT